MVLSDMASVTLFPRKEGHTSCCGLEVPVGCALVPKVPVPLSLPYLLRMRARISQLSPAHVTGWSGHRSVLSQGTQTWETRGLGSEGISAGGAAEVPLEEEPWHCLTVSSAGTCARVCGCNETRMLERLPRCGKTFAERMREVAVWKWCDLSQFIV